MILVTATVRDLHNMSRSALHSVLSSVQNVEQKLWLASCKLEVSSGDHDDWSRHVLWVLLAYYLEICLFRHFNIL